MIERPACRESADATAVVAGLVGLAEPLVELEQRVMGYHSVKARSMLECAGLIRGKSGEKYL